MKRININLIVVALLLFLVSIVAYVFWNTIKYLICNILESGVMTAIIWILLFVIAIIHYFNNNIEDKNLINDREGLEKPFDYLQFVGTYGVILTSAQRLGKEFFLQWNFPDVTSCKNFTNIDNISLLCCVFVLVHYSFIKVSPIAIEAFTKKSPIQRN